MSGKARDETHDPVGGGAARFIADCADLPGPEVRKRLNAKHYGKLPPRSWILFNLGMHGK